MVKLTVNVSPEDGGMVVVNGDPLSSYPAESAFENSSYVSVEAIAASGYRFESWSGDLSGMDNPNNIMMDCDKEVTANFAREDFNLWLPGGVAGGIVIIGGILWLAVRKRASKSGEIITAQER